MSKVEKAAQALLEAGESSRARFRGRSPGLNDAASNPIDGLIVLTDNAVIVAWEKLGIVNKGIAERFSAREVSVTSLEWDEMPGIGGAMEARGLGNTHPTLRLATPKGSFSLYFKRNHMDQAVQARELLSRRAG